MGVLVFGDSYVAAADRWRPGYARLLPFLMLTRGQHMGSGGTGFLKSNGGRGPYHSRLPALLEKNADVLVVQATGNDALLDPDEARVVAKDFLTQVAARFPRVVVLGPMWAKDGADNLPALTAAVRAAAESCGADFVDTSGWVSPRLIGPDGAHPTWLGHAVIAWRAAKALRRGSRPGRP